MAEGRMLVIVPTRGRPHSVLPIIEAWLDTEAYGYADLLFAVDRDDPELNAYLQHAHPEVALFAVHTARRMMVPKLNRTAVKELAREPYYAVGFAGDDHIPRTTGWAKRYHEELQDLGTGIVYGDDLLQGEKLPTQWVMTSDIVHALGRMVPAGVEHLYCDNAILNLGQGAGCIRYLPDVVIEHMHPAVGKAPEDDGYRTVNCDEQIQRDRAAYDAWVRHDLLAHVDAVRALRKG